MAWNKFAERPKPDRRKTILLWATMAIAVTALFPPWLYTFNRSSTADDAGGRWEVSAGYACIFRPPTADLTRLDGSEEVFNYISQFRALPGVRLDTARLFAEWTCILAVSGAAWGLVRLKAKQAV